MNTYNETAPERMTHEIDQAPEPMPAARLPESPVLPLNEASEVTAPGFDSDEDFPPHGGDTPTQQDNLVDINEYKAAKTGDLDASEDPADPPSRVIDVRPSPESLPKPIMDSPITDQRVATLKSDSATDTDKEAAFTSIYLEYYDHIKNYTTKISGSDAFGQEIAQETFEKIWTKVGMFKDTGEGSFKSWVFRMAHNAAINYTRTAKNHPTSGGFGFYPEEILGPIKIVAGSTPIADTETMVEFREALEEKLQILDELKPHYRDILVMSALDFSHEDMAQAIDGTVASARSRLFRARQSLAKLYAERQEIELIEDEPETEEVDEDLIT